MRRNTAASYLPHWIMHSHILSDDDYECSVCHSRFQEKSGICPACGSFMQVQTEKDDFEWIDEAAMLDAVWED